MKDAQDALVFKNSQSALLGGENPTLNNELKEQSEKGFQDNLSEFQAPMSVTGSKRANQTPMRELRDGMKINREKGETSSVFDSLSIAGRSSFSYAPSQCSMFMNKDKVY